MMAGPKVSWFRRELDYWKYCARKRILTLLSLVFLILGLIGLTPFAPNFGYRDWISYACFIGAILLILIDDLSWKNKFKKMKVRREIKMRDTEFAQEVQVYGGRPFIIFEEINKAIRSRYFKQKPVNIEGSYELHADARKKAIMFLEYFRLGYFHGTPGKQKKMWNDTKIRLHSSTDDLLGDAPVGLKITSYFDYLGTAFFSFRECLYDNDLFYDGKSLMKTYNGKLASIKDTKTAHHIGINALLITADKKILYQETKALAAPDHHAPSGSGSLDFKDIELTSFEKTLLNGALREFSEETGWNDIAAYGKKAKLLAKI